MIHSKQAKILEVIVTSLADAMEAQAGGADRLEVVRDLQHGGLTPDLALVREIAASVTIPIRIMVRENSSMQLASAAELHLLCRQAAEFNSLSVDGIVAGFILNDEVDLDSLHTIAEAAPRMKITFHRAFDALSDPLLAIRTLKTVPQVDRILTTGERGGETDSWPERKLRLHDWQRRATPEITILAGAGTLETVINDLRRDLEITEMHIGRAARIPPETGGQVNRLQVARIKGIS
jgi:copper homeostasis protein